MRSAHVIYPNPILQVTFPLVVCVFLVAISRHSYGDSLVNPNSDSARLIRTREAFNAWRSRISNLYYESESIGRSINSPKGTKQRIRSRFAAADGYRFEEVQHKYGITKWSDDLGWLRTWMRPGSVETFLVIDRICTRSERFASAVNNPKLRDTDFDFYMQCIGWWPPSPRNPTNTESREPSASAARILELDSCRITAINKRENGIVCDVVEAHYKDVIDVLYIAPELGGALVTRKQSNTSNGVHCTVENGDFREAVRGVWLPWCIKREVYIESRDAPKSEADILSQMNFDLLKVQVNEIDERFFESSLPSGTIIVDFDNQTTKKLSGGLVLLEDSIRIGQQILRGSVKRSSENSNHLRSVHLGSCTIALICGLVFTVCMRRVALRR